MHHGGKIKEHILVGTLALSLLGLTACAGQSGGTNPGMNPPGTGLTGPSQQCYVHLFDSDAFDSTDANNVINDAGRFANLRNLPGATVTDWDGEMDSFKVGLAATVRVWTEEDFQGATQTYQPSAEEPDTTGFYSMDITCG